MDKYEYMDKTHKYMDVAFLHHPLYILAAHYDVQWKTMSQCVWAGSI